MSFGEIAKRVRPSLKRVTRQLNGHFSFFDDEDLFQEALLHLWSCYKNGQLHGKNNSYILQSCTFHLKNYLRKARDKASFISLDEPINGTGITFSEVIPENRPGLDESLEAKLLIEKIKGNGLTKREKEVFSLSLEGLTVREIGRRLNISHVRVVKLKGKIRYRYEVKFKR